MENREFFNSIAQDWDNICIHPKEKIEYVMNKIQVKPKEYVLDVGSGTGIIIPYIEKYIGAEGKIKAIDISQNMIEVSKRKNNFNNLEFIVGDFLKLNTEELFDTIIAYSCYPHFDDKNKFFEKSYSLLKPKGKVVIAHVQSKEEINLRHKQVETKIESEDLLSIDKLIKLAQKYKFLPIYKEDSDQYYIYIGQKK